MIYVIVIFQSKTIGPVDAYVEKAQCERSEHEVGTQGVGQTRASGRMRGPRIPDHLSRSAGARRVHGPESHCASTRRLPKGVGKAVRHGGSVQPADIDRPQPQHADLGQASARAGHGQHRQRIHSNSRWVKLSRNRNAVHSSNTALDPND